MYMDNMSQGRNMGNNGIFSGIRHLEYVLIVKTFIYSSTKYY